MKVEAAEHVAARQVILLHEVLSDLKDRKGKGCGRSGGSPSTSYVQRCSSARRRKAGNVGGWADMLRLTQKVSGSRGSLSLSVSVPLSLPACLPLCLSPSALRELKRAARGGKGFGDSECLHSFRPRGGGGGGGDTFRKSS